MRMTLLSLAAIAAAITVPVALGSPEEPRCSAEFPAACLNGVSVSVTSLDTLRVFGTGAKPAGQQADEEQERATALLRGHGEAGGWLTEQAFGGWGIWGSGSYADYESDTTVAPYDANAYTYFVGADRMVGDQWSLGAAIGFEDVDTDTDFNGGGQDTDGYTVALFGTYLINDRYSLDLMTGWSWLDFDQDRIDPASVPGAPSSLKADFDGERWFGAATLNGFWEVGSCLVSGRFGYTHAEEEQDGYTETGGVGSARTVRQRRVRLGQIGTEVELSRPFDAWEPYVSAAFRKDVVRDDGSGAGGLPSAVGSTQPGDRTEAELGAGVRLFAANGFSGIFEWRHTTGREKFDNDVVSLIVRMDL